MAKRTNERTIFLLLFLEETGEAKNKSVVDQIWNWHLVVGRERGCAIFRFLWTFQAILQTDETTAGQ